VGHRVAARDRDQPITNSYELLPLTEVGYEPLENGSTEAEAVFQTTDQSGSVDAVESSR